MTESGNIEIPHPWLLSRTVNPFPDIILLIIDLNSDHLTSTISIAFSGQTILQLSHLVQID